jgi:hypothetical protein
MVTVTVTDTVALAGGSCRVPGAEPRARAAAASSDSESGTVTGWPGPRPSGPVGPGRAGGRAPGPRSSRSLPAARGTSTRPSWRGKRTAAEPRRPGQRPTAPRARGPARRLRLSRWRPGDRRHVHRRPSQTSGQAEAAAGPPGPSRLLAPGPLSLAPGTLTVSARVDLRLPP